MVAKTTGTGPCSPVEPRTSIEFYAIAASRRNKIRSKLPRKRGSRISNLSSLTGVTLIVKSCGDVWRSQKRENRRGQTPLRAAMERPHWKTAIGGVARERRHMGGGGEEKEWEESESIWRVDGRERWNGKSAGRCAWRVRSIARSPHLFRPSSNNGYCPARHRYLVAVQKACCILPYCLFVYPGRVFGPQTNDWCRTSRVLAS